MEAIDPRGLSFVLVNSRYPIDDALTRYTRFRLDKSSKRSYHKLT